MSGKSRGVDALQGTPPPADVTFKTLAGSNSRTGTGKLLEMTDTKVVFTTDWPIEVGKKLELSIRWPSPAGTTPTLRLIVHGTVARFEEGRASVDIGKYGDS